MQETKIQAKQSKSKPQPQRNNQSFEDWNNNNKIQWIERLLQTPIPDYRNLTVWHILAPYLITLRGLSYDESYAIIHEWLNKCNELGALRFNPHHKIIGSLKSALGFFPITLQELGNKRKQGEPIMTLLFIKRLNDTFEENAEKLIKDKHNIQR